MGKHVRCWRAARADNLGAKGDAEPGGAVTSLSLQTPPKPRVRGPSQDLSCVLPPLWLFLAAGYPRVPLCQVRAGLDQPNPARERL